jgi:hypothetical protein
MKKGSFVDRVLHGDNPDRRVRRIRFWLLVGWASIAGAFVWGRCVGLW